MIWGLCLIFYTCSQKVNEKSIHDKFEAAWGVKLPINSGLALTEMVNRAADGKIKALYIMGENPLVSEPDLNHLENSLNNLELLVFQDIFLTETEQFADVVFPAFSSFEKDGTFTNTERRVSAVRKLLNPKGEAKDDWVIIQMLANAMGASWGYSSWKDIMSEINSVTPQYAGITSERIINNEGLQWPCPDALHPGTPVLHTEKFTRGKGKIIPVVYSGPKEPFCKEFPFVMTTGRILYHYHSGSMTRRSEALNSFISVPYFEMNKEDMGNLGITENEIVTLVSKRGEISIHAKCSSKVAAGSIFVPFHFAEAAANKLTLANLDPIAKIPELKVCAVNIKKIR